MPSATPETPAPTGSVSIEPDDGTLDFGEEAETLPGLTISISKPKATDFDQDSTAPKGSAYRGIVMKQTYSNTTSSLIDLSSGGAEAMAGDPQTPCEQVFGQTPRLEAKSTGPVPAQSKKQYLIGFSCKAKKGDPLTVSAWAQEKDAMRNAENVVFTGTMP